MTIQHLFQKKRFQMHSGGFSDFKLECDALTSEDYETLAFLVARKIKYNQVFGVPRGGLAFAKALSKYSVTDSNIFLIADDVLTTGGSMRDALEQLQKTQAQANNGKVYEYKGIVIFSRGENPEWINAIFHLDQKFWQND